MYCNRLHARWSTQSRLATLLSSLITSWWVGLQTLWRFRLKDSSIDEMVGAWCFGCCQAHQDCFCYAFMHICLLMPCGHQLGKGWPLGSRLWCLIVKLSLSHWYPGSGVVLDCIHSWSLPFFSLLLHSGVCNISCALIEYLTQVISLQNKLPASFYLS